MATLESTVCTVYYEMYCCLRFSHLLESVGEVDDGAGGPRVAHEQQHLRPPELDVLLSRVEEQKVLAHLQCQGTALFDSWFSAELRWTLRIV